MTFLLITFWFPKKNLFNDFFSNFLKFWWTKKFMILWLNQEASQFLRKHSINKEKIEKKHWRERNQTQTPCNLGGARKIEWKISTFLVLLFIIIILLLFFYATIAFWVFQYNIIICMRKKHHNSWQMIYC